MTSQNPGEHGKFTGDWVAGTHPQKTMAPSLTEDRRVSPQADSSRAQQETDDEPMPGKSSRVDWQMVALWVFVTVSFAALAATVYLIWAKCRGVSPF
jgi:hypothetical protein